MAIFLAKTFKCPIKNNTWLVIGVCHSAIHYRFRDLHGGSRNFKTRGRGPCAVEFLCYDAPSHIPYDFVARVVNKIQNVDIVGWHKLPKFFTGGAHPARLSWTAFETRVKCSVYCFCSVYFVSTAPTPTPIFRRTLRDLKIVYCDAARNVNKVRVRIFNEPTDYSSVANPTHRNYKETLIQIATH